MLHRLRRRFGVSAPRVLVRAHVPWHLRLLAALLLLTAVIVLTGLAYAVGRHYTGYDKTLEEQELVSLRSRVEVLENEAEHFRATSNGSEASLQIERTAQQKLSEQVKQLEAENGRLREDLAAFENLASGEAKNETIGIHRMQVKLDPTAAEGVYQYRFLLAAPVSRPDREFRGRLQLVATVQQAGRAVIVNIPATGAADSQKFLLSFKYFRRVEGSFALPANAVLKKLEARLMQGESLVTSQQVTM